MSHYCDIQLQLQGSHVEIIEALCEMGWKKEDIQYHEERQHLYGYMNDKRSQQAHIIINRKVVCKGVGRASSASNDIGLERMADGKWRAHISEFDRGIGFDDAWQKRLLSKWAICRATSEARKKGWSYTVEHATENGQQFAYVNITPSGR